MPPPLTILLDTTDLQAVRASQPEALGGNLLVMDADLHAQLKDMAQPHRSPWDFMTHADLPALAKLEQEAVWFFTSAWRVPGERVDPLALAGYRHRRWLARFTWALFAIERALDRLKPSQILVIDEPLTHGLDRAPDERRAPFIQAIARWAAAQRGIPVDLVEPLATPRDAEPPLDPVHAGERAAVASATVLATGTPWALIFGVGVDASRQAPLVRALADQSGFRAVHVIGAQTDAALLARLRQEAGALHEYELAPPEPTPTTAPTAPRDADQQAWPPASVPPRLRGVFANEFLRPHFDFLLGSYRRAMQGHAGRWLEALGRHRPSLVVCSYPAPIFDVAASMGIPTLMLPHGPMIVGEHRLYESLPHDSKIGAVSEVHRQLLRRRGIDAARIHITGDPGAAEMHAPHGARAHSGRESTAPPRLLVLTAHTTHPARLGTIPEVDFVREALVLEQVAALTARVPCTIEVRSHPRYDHQPAYFERLSRFAGPLGTLELESPGSLNEAVERSTLVVVPCGRSSAIPEASGLGKPVYLLTDVAVWFDTAAWGLQRWPVLGSVRDLAAEVEAIASEGGPTRSPRWDAAARQTAEALHAWTSPAGNPLERTALVIQKLLQRAPERISH